MKIIKKALKKKNIKKNKNIEQFFRYLSTLKARTLQQSMSQNKLHLPNDKLTKKPNCKTWSIAQITQKHVCVSFVCFVSFRLNLKDLQNEMHHNRTTVQTHRFHRADCIFITLHWNRQLGIRTVVLHRCICRRRQVEIFTANLRYSIAYPWAA